MFRFKKFEVDQTGCAMKINTDGVLLGVFATAANPLTILDIGTGTGVIALMLAQKFENAIIDAVEIDEVAAQTAAQNFTNSVFDRRLTLYPLSFQHFFQNYTNKKYDLIISNPPFYINSLEAAAKQMNVAKHANGHFFEELIDQAARHLSTQGLCWLILPLATAALVKALAGTNKLYVQQSVFIRSFADDEPHREILALSLNEGENHADDFIIYQQLKIYTQDYKNKLKDFFTIF